jgi:eukaryotic-like serine/threonine-protein kinase
VFSSNRSGSIQIWTSDADGSRAVQLTNMDPFATTGSPRWSPDGQRIVFDSNAGGGYQVYEISAEGGQPKALTTGKSNSFIGAWSPDGRSIYFTSDRSGRLEVWRMPSGGGTPEQFTREGGQAATVSADNAWVYYTKKDGADGLWRMPVNGGDESQLVDAVFRYNFAPTAEGVYYGTPPKPDSTSSVRFLEFKSGRQRDIVALDKLADLGVAVSPDGKFLLFTKLDYSGTDLMLVENFR